MADPPVAGKLEIKVSYAYNQSVNQKKQNINKKEIEITSDDLCFQYFEKQTKGYQ